MLGMVRLPKSPRPGLTLRSVCSVLTLLVYTTVATGVPMGGHRNSQNTACRCSQDVRKSTACCCRTVSVVPDSNDTDRVVRTGRSSFKQNAARSHTSKQRAVKNTCCSSKIAKSRPANNRSCCQSGGRRDDTSAGRQVIDSDGDCRQPHAGQFGVPAVVNACNCGNDAAVGFYCNTDPRLPVESVNILPGVNWQTKFKITCQILPHHITTPETPPPEVSVA